MTSSRRPSASRTRVWMRDTSKALAVLMANVRRTRDQKPQAEVRREIAGPTRHGRARPGHSLACTVIPGRCDSIEPGISRFRVRLFEAPRNDGGEIGRDYPEPVVMQSHRHDFPIPRACFARALLHSLPSFETEGAGKAGWPLHPGLPRKSRLAQARKPQVQADTLRPSLRSGFTAYT